MKGEGVWAQLLAQRVAHARRRYGLHGERTPLDLSQFRPPPRVQAASERQGELF
jgi:hypothetical protein